MSSALVLIHTIPALVTEFSQLCAEMLPDVAMKHILDEPLLERVRQRGHLAAEDCERLAQHVALAESVGATAVLVTCSTISPCVDAMRRDARVPILKIDEAMITLAVQSGIRIGLLATNPTTLIPSRDLLLSEAVRVGKSINIESRLVEQALSARMAGDALLHDRLIDQAVQSLAPSVDVIVLAQASMARALSAITDPGVPVLASPRLALQQIRDILSLARVPSQ